MSFVMTYAAAVPNEKKQDFVAHAKAMAELWKEYGAIRVVESWGADVPAGEETSFPLAVKAGEGETVVMGWQEWPSQEEQQKGYAAAMSDPRLREMGAPPINARTMIFAGFETMLDI